MEIVFNENFENNGTGRVLIEGSPVGLWWKFKNGGYGANCGPLGYFYGATIEELLGAVEEAEKNRLSGIAFTLSRLREMRREKPESKNEINQSKTK